MRDASPHGEDSVWSQRAARVLADYLSHLPHHAVVSLCVASFVVLIKPLGLFESLDDALLMQSQSVANVAVRQSSPVPQLSSVAIVKIDAERFSDFRHYAGTSPLNRCVLARDLESLLHTPGVRLVAVDFDLSPTERGYFVDAETLARRDDTGRQATLNKIGAERDCQERLDALLTHDDHRRRLVLMAPAQELPSSIQPVVEAWLRGMRESGLAFGDVTLRESRGLVKQYHDPTACRSGAAQHAEVLPAFGDLVRQHVHSQHRASQPLNVGESEPGACVRDLQYQAVSALFRRGLALGVDDLCLGPAAIGNSNCGISTLIFGPGYTRDDEHLTPIGFRHGVDVHAAAAACAAPTRLAARLGPYKAFFFEILVAALVAAPVIHLCWLRYYEVRSGRRRDRFRAYRAAAVALQGPRSRFWAAISRAAVQPAAAYLWLLLLPIFLVVLLALLMFAAAIAAGTCLAPTIPGALLLGLIVEGATVHNARVGAEFASTLNGERLVAVHQGWLGLNLFRSLFRLACLAIVVLALILLWKT